MNSPPPPPPRPAPRAGVTAPSRPESTLPGDLTRGPSGITGRHVTLCVTGSVAAYKAVQVARLLLAEGAMVDVVLTRGAREFVGAATFAGITGRRVLSEMFDPELEGEPHVALGKESDLVLVAPATADVLSRMAAGRADDLLTALALCAGCPVLVAPAMHPSMWTHPATQRNVATLVADRRVDFIGPVEGEVASGDVGVGRMAEPEVIVGEAIGRLSGATLRGRHVLITAGPTAEDIDPVRYIGNRSSGKMGFAIAERAAQRGAQVTLIAGPVSLPTPVGVNRVDVRSAEEMRSALWRTLGSDLSGVDAVVMAAAVADYRPSVASPDKLRRQAEGLTLELVPNPDLLAEIGRTRQGDHPVLVGFALETVSDEKAVASARSKLMSKRVDLVVANRADESIGRDDTRILLVGARTCEVIERTSKRIAADRLLDRVSAELTQRGR
jgi:phosphopantothenoylcysteine decarboxylase / phosphopantothenate---cysteine ligase